MNEDEYNDAWPWPPDWPWIKVGEDNYLCHQDKGLFREDEKPLIAGSGMWWAHNKPDGHHCGLARISFDPGYHVLVSRDPLTITASLLCSCGLHGFVTDGKWVSA